MSRYIDADDIDNITVFCDSRGCLTKIEAPTADVEPVVHAHWIKHEWAEEVEGRLIPNYECSHCHEWFRDNRRRCGECGAKMDEAVKDDD